MLKILKINVPVTLKADPDDQDDLRERLFEHLQIGIEGGDLDFDVMDEESEEVEMEEQYES